MKMRSGWVTFAGVMIFVVGVLNAFDGLVAITQTRYIERNIGGELPITNNVKNWGWGALIMGDPADPHRARHLLGGDVGARGGHRARRPQPHVPVRLPRAQHLLVVDDDRDRHHRDLRPGGCDRQRRVRRRRHVHPNLTNTPVTPRRSRLHVAPGAVSRPVVTSPRRPVIDCPGLRRRGRSRKGRTDERGSLGNAARPHRHGRDLTVQPRGVQPRPRDPIAARRTASGSSPAGSSPSSRSA